MDTVKLTFKYTQGEYVKAEKQYLLASKTINKTSIVVLAVYLPFSILYLFLSSFSILSIIFVVVAFIAVATGCTLYLYTPVYKFKQTSKYHEEYHLNFSEDDIKFKTPTINSALKWDIYSEIWESDDFYFLIQAPQMYTLIPKRAFVSHVDKQAFEKIALSSLNCTKRTV